MKRGISCQKLESERTAEIDESGFKTSLQTCLHLMPDWLVRAKEDYREEGRGWPVLLLAGRGRAAVWNAARGLNVGGDGVAALACRLMERYLSAQLRHNAESVDFLQFERFQRRLRSKIPILITSCVQIAAKSISVSKALPATQVSNYLLLMDMKVSIKDVVAFEYHVFETIGFHVPLWTSLEMAHLLAMQARLVAAALLGLPHVVNLAELKRDKIEKQVSSTAGFSPDSSSSSSSEGEGRPRSLVVRTLHLAAGAVAACAHYCALCPAPDLAPRLAAAADAPRAFIECVRDSILIAIHDGGTHNSKRPRLD